VLAFRENLDAGCKALILSGALRIMSGGTDRAVIQRRGSLIWEGEHA